MSPNLLQIDAFADAPFTGNPAAIVFEAGSASDAWMQSLAVEMNLSETAFLEKRGDNWSIRWFTPAFEVDLCGHATLAAAHAIWETGRAPGSEAITFESRSGPLLASREGSTIWLDFPAEPVAEFESRIERDALVDALRLTADSVAYAGCNHTSALVQVAQAKDVLAAAPDFAALARLPPRGTILTGPPPADRDCDFISRYFAPAAGIDEDPVTGSAHCALAPHWSERLGRAELTGYQASKRGGTVLTRFSPPRVHLGGSARTVLRGEVTTSPA